MFTPAGVLTDSIKSGLENLPARPYIELTSILSRNYKKNSNKNGTDKRDFLNAALSKHFRKI